MMCVVNPATLIFSPNIELISVVLLAFLGPIQVLNCGIYNEL